LLKNRPSPITAVSFYPGDSFHWNGHDRIVERSWGPERIETGWWRGNDIRRDYYIVETDAGERLWVFRNLLDESWYLHGVFA
jgi:protein ImuB